MPDPTLHSATQLCNWDPGSKCSECAIHGRLQCRSSLWDMARFQGSFLCFSLPSFFGMELGGYPEAALGWLGFLALFFGVWATRVLCAHCPYYARPGFILRCKATVGPLKIWAYRPEPISNIEKVQFLLGLMVILVFPFPFLILARQHLALVLALAGLAILLWIMMGIYCTRCPNVSCVLNWVPSTVADEYLSRNPRMKSNRVVIAFLCFSAVSHWPLHSAAVQSMQQNQAEERARQRLSADGKDGRPIVAHLYVALCDNANQGILPVPKALGNGQNPANNLYWGARYGVAGYLGSLPGWRRVLRIKNPHPGILERAIFSWGRNPSPGSQAKLFVVADAYDGRAISQAMVDFLEAAGGASKELIELPDSSDVKELQAAGLSHLAAYVGHNGLMDAPLAKVPARGGDGTPRYAVVLACASRPYFENLLRTAGAFPLLWTTGLMAPEAYTLVAALESWANGASAQEVRRRAAQAYNQHQKCGLSAAYILFAAGGN